MSDVMQIAGHAALRMNRIDIKKTAFHLIFAGVNDIIAKDKNQMGQDNVIKEINEILQKAAALEGRHDLKAGLASFFPQLTDEMPELDFPSILPMLWQSSTMNPPESRYGEMVVKLRCSLLEYLKKSHGKRTQNIMGFAQKLMDLW